MKSFIQFLKDALVEFKHVTWPTREQLQKHTTLVLGFVAVFVLFITGIDGLFSFGYDYLTKDIKPKTYQDVNRTTTTPEVSRDSTSTEVKNTNTAPAANGNVNSATPSIQAVDENGNPVEGVTITPVTGNVNAK